MDANSLRKKFLDFFKEKGHAIIPSASLIPENDPSVLFTTAGMHPLVPYLLGEKHPLGQRLVNFQKCIRTGDIDEVGDDAHLTFFEMLGNWSLGDYWKKEAIEWSFEFLTKVLGLDIKKLAVSCFAGDNDSPRDEESAKIWEGLGIPKNRVYFFGKNDNWWGPAGQTGPCGPDTEMFYWTGEDEPPDLVTADNKSGWVEIWNDVFMEFNKTASGNYEVLKQQNVDTGMGLERVIAVLNGKTNVFETDSLEPIMNKIKELAKKEDVRAKRIVADHLRSAMFILGDEKGIEPSNVGAGYVLRRLIRRAIRYGRQLGIDGQFTSKIAEVVIKKMKDVYPELEKNKIRILDELNKEEEKFKKTLEEGLKITEKLFGTKQALPDDKYKKLTSLPNYNQLLKNMWIKRRNGEDYSIKEADITKNEIETAMVNGQEGFLLYQSYGFPMEMILEFVIEKGLLFDRYDFRQEVAKHQDLSRTASAGMFKGGLADNSETTTRYHTATHLLLAALRQVLGGEIYQKGSNITAERVRFDFNYPEKLTPEQLKQVEDIVNAKIVEAIPVEMTEMPKEEALKISKVSFDPSKYPDIVKVYKIGDPALGAGQAFSIEVCGGPHAGNNSELGHLKITKEESSSSGIRRIKAPLS